MKAIELEKTDILESKEALTFYLETLFRQETDIDSEETDTELNSKELESVELLFFSIDGHKLAVPVKDLKGVIDVEQNSLINLPESKPYTIGYIHYQGKNIPVNDIYWALNSHGSLMPPKENHAQEIINHVIIFGDERMGIPCEEVFNITTVQKEKIKWRKSRPKQRWFKGIHTEDMSVILSVTEIKRLFLRAYKTLD